MLVGIIYYSSNNFTVGIFLTNNSITKTFDFDRIIVTRMSIGQLWHAISIQWYSFVTTPFQMLIISAPKFYHWAFVNSKMFCSIISLKFIFRCLFPFLLSTFMYNAWSRSLWLMIAVLWMLLSKLLYLIACLDTVFYLTYTYF